MKSAPPVKFIPVGKSKMYRFTKYQISNRIPVKESVRIFNKQTG